MEELRASGLKKSLPNIISCIRITGAFALPFLIWEKWEINFSLPFVDKTFPNVPVVWIIVYLFLLSTDKLDGTLARRLRAESGLGAALDSIADVLALVMGATLCFVRFVGDNLETWQFWLYVGMMVLTVFNMLAINIYATIDESVYCARTAEYNVDFKGHGFEKYKKRESAAGV